MQEPTPIIADLCAMDVALGGADPVLQHCNGDFYSEDGYTPTETPLADGAAMAFAPREGRPCDGAFPYFRILLGGGGVAVAVGWPAQWSAEFTRVAEGVHVRAGQEGVHLRLLPGETVRTPRMAVLSWVGDASRGVNIWRRWYLDHVLPRCDGRPLQPMLSCSCNDGGEEFTQATEENQLRFMEAFRRQGFDFDVWCRRRVVFLQGRQRRAPLGQHGDLGARRRALSARTAARRGPRRRWRGEAPAVV